jgi:hypothetical protein
MTLLEICKQPVDEELYQYVLWALNISEKWNSFPWIDDLEFLNKIGPYQ